VRVLLLRMDACCFHLIALVCGLRSALILDKEFSSVD